MDGGESGETPPIGKSTLQVSELERPSRKDLSPASAHHEGTTKSGHDFASQARYLSPSPAPSSRFSTTTAEPHFTYSPHTSTGDVPPYGNGRSSVVRRFWARNKGACLVALSQFFGALMNLLARLLELEGDGMHPVQALLIRQGLTMVCCYGYMWWMKVPGIPFGGKDIRLLLLIRGIAGFFGIFSMWYSMMYLPLADATVITFLGPGIAGILCYIFLKEPFTRTEQLATLVAFSGVVLIAQPSTFFSKAENDAEEGTAQNPEGAGSHLPGLDHETTREERLMAIGVALIGVLGAGSAFTTLRMIGKRAHPLISIGVFALTSTVISSVTLVGAPLLDIGQPALSWVWPSSVTGWLLLPALGILGFVMQYCLTSGLAADKSNKANAMVYTHMLFAAGFDRWIFHHEMNLMSFGGCVLILGSALWVVLLRRSAPSPTPKTEDVERQVNAVGEAERSPMLVGVEGGPDEVPMERLRLG